jgi:hypothetical protein
MLRTAASGVPAARCVVPRLLLLVDGNELLPINEPGASLAG